MNLEETRMPEEAARRRLSSRETIPPGVEDQQALEALPLAAGESVANGYLISAALSRQGRQADVYLAKKWGQSYAVKLYRNGWRPSGRMQSFLRNVRHPNIAGLADCGEHQGRYYEIYPYYQEGTLEEAAPLSISELQSVVIPSVNEGLHYLHANGVIHCDVKPGNLFFDENQTRVVIGDCGISDFINARGKLIDSVRGTPEYAPRVKALLWSAALSPAYDYGSFGLVLCRLITGRSLFEGMSIEEISAAWERGIRLPDCIEGRMRTLVEGLLQEDEERRWGYERVRRWCKGEFLTSGRVHSRQKTGAARRPLIFGRFDGEMVSVTSLSQLSRAIRAHWERAAQLISRRELPEFIQQFDTGLADDVRRWGKGRDTDAAVFQLLSRLDDGDGIFYCGRDYGTPEAYISCLSQGEDQAAVRFMTSGLFVQYLRERGAEPQLLDQLEQRIRQSGEEDLSVIRGLCFTLQGKSSIFIHGMEVNTLEDLIQVVSSLSTREISGLLEQEIMRAWLYRMGFGQELERMAELEGL